MKFIYWFVSFLIFITLGCIGMLVVDDIKAKRVEEIRAANSYIYEKYTQVEIKKERERKNDEYIRQKFGKLWGIE